MPTPSDIAEPPPAAALQGLLRSRFQARLRRSDLALRGTGADYLVDEAHHLLEVAGRSPRRDFEVAWQQRWQRLTEYRGNGLYVCVVEFATPLGRLAFRE